MRTWVGKPGSFQQNIIKSTLPLHEVLDSGNPTVLDTAAQAPVCEFEELFRLLRVQGNVDRLCCLRMSLSREPWKSLDIPSMSCVLQRINTG